MRHKDAVRMQCLFVLRIWDVPCLSCKIGGARSVLILYCCEQFVEVELVESVELFLILLSLLLILVRDEFDLRLAFTE